MLGFTANRNLHSRIGQRSIRRSIANQNRDIGFAGGKISLRRKKRYRERAGGALRAHYGIIDIDIVAVKSVSQGRDRQENDSGR